MTPDPDSQHRRIRILNLYARDSLTPTVSRKTMVLISDGNSEINAHVGVISDV